MKLAYTLSEFAGKQIGTTCEVCHQCTSETAEGLMEQFGDANMPGMLTSIATREGCDMVAWSWWSPVMLNKKSRPNGRPLNRKNEGRSQPV
jgi:hypothetical protein